MKVVFLNPKISLCFTWVESAKLFAKVVVPFSIPTIKLFISSLTLNIISPSNFGYIGIHSDFNFKFFTDYWTWISFHIFIYNLCISFGEIAIRQYILDMNSWSCTCFANILSLSLCCLPIYFLMVTFKRVT